MAGRWLRLPCIRQNGLCQRYAVLIIESDLPRYSCLLKCVQCGSAAHRVLESVGRRLIYEVSHRTLTRSLTTNMERILPGSIYLDLCVYRDMVLNYLFMRLYYISLKGVCTVLFVYIYVEF